MTERSALTQKVIDDTVGINPVLAAAMASTLKDSTGFEYDVAVHRGAEVTVYLRPIKEGESLSPTEFLSMMGEHRDPSVVRLLTAFSRVAGAQIKLVRAWPSWVTETIPLSLGT